MGKFADEFRSCGQSVPVPLSSSYIQGMDSNYERRNRFARGTPIHTNINKTHHSYTNTENTNLLLILHFFFLVLPKKNVKHPQFLHMKYLIYLPKKFFFIFFQI